MTTDNIPDVQCLIALKHVEIRFDLIALITEIFFIVGIGGILPFHNTKALKSY